MDDRGHAAQRVVEGVGVPDVALDQLGIHAGQVRGVAGGQVVKHADPVAARHQAPDQRRANETGPAGHQDFFGSTHKSGSLAGDGRGRRRVGDSRDGPNGRDWPLKIRN